MRTLRLLLTGITLAVSLAGCGLGGGLPLLDREPTRNPRALDAPSGAVLAAVRQAWGQTHSASGVVAFWEQAGRETSASKAEFFWSRPSKLRANILEADSFTKRGVKLVTLGDGRVTAKAGFIKRNFRIDDPEVLSLRGYRLDQTSLTAIVDGLLDPAATVRHAGETTLTGRSADLLDLRGGSGMLPGCTRMRLAIDRETRMPLLVEGFEGDTPVFRAQLSGMAINPKLSDDLFKL